MTAGWCAWSTAPRSRPERISARCRMRTMKPADSIRALSNSTRSGFVLMTITTGSFAMRPPICCSLCMPQRGKQFGDGLASHWIDPVRRDFVERFEHELALAESRMRDDQVRHVDDGVAVENEIEIERARRVLVRMVAAEALFDGVQHVEDGGRRERRVANRRRVEKHRLRRGHADRRRF